MRAGDRFLDEVCLAGVPWYAVAAGPQLTVGQIPFFIAEISAIDTAYKLTAGLFQIEIVQNALLTGLTNFISIPQVDPRVAARHDQTSLVGFTVKGTLNCKNLGDDNGLPHAVGNVVGNINIPPALNQ
jgi:hypothetical protein